MLSHNVTILQLCLLFHVVGTPVGQLRNDLDWMDFGSANQIPLIWDNSGKSAQIVDRSNCWGGGSPDGCYTDTTDDDAHAALSNFGVVSPAYSKFIGGIIDRPPDSQLPYVLPYLLNGTLRIPVTWPYYITALSGQALPANSDGSPVRFALQHSMCMLHKCKFASCVMGCKKRIHVCMAYGQGTLHAGSILA